MKERAVELMIAFARYQTLAHPRAYITGTTTYQADSFTSEELVSILIDTPSIACYPLSKDQDHGSTTVNLGAVVGDTVLSSAAWIAGSKGLTPKDVFDCCIVSLSLPASSASPAQIVTIPAVRFVCGVPAAGPGPFDVETTQPIGSMSQFIPKSSTNLRPGNSWWYYIPCQNGLWLLIKQNTSRTIIGKQTAEIVNDAQITATLARGNLNISLAHAEEIRHTAELSEKARCVMVSLLAG